LLITADSMETGVRMLAAFTVTAFINSLTLRRSRIPEILRTADEIEPRQRMFLSLSVQPEDHFFA